MLARRRRLSGLAGFTIIETIITIALAGVIIGIVFIAIPHLQRTQRNFARRRFAQTIMAAMEEYRSNSGSHNYPLDGTAAASSVDNRCDFLRRYIINAASSCVETGDPSGEFNCVTNTVGNQYKVCFHNNGGNHEYEGEHDEVSIELGHQCAPSPDDTEHVVSGPGGDSNFTRFAVWTLLEPSSIYCIDNGTPF